MIEKLDIKNGGVEDLLNCIKKINELIGAVNDKQIQLNNHECRLLDLHRRITALDDPTYHEAEPADPYTEQRKWIGKLCWFWSKDLKQCGILTAIFDNNKYGEDELTEEYPFQRDSIGCWQHCEPVKPDDDIIYKGGDNE